MGFCEWTFSTECCAFQVHPYGSMNRSFTPLAYGWTNTPLHGRTTFYFLLQSLLGIWVVSTFCLLTNSATGNIRRCTSLWKFVFISLGSAPMNGIGWVRGKLYGFNFLENYWLSRAASQLCSYQPWLRAPVSPHHHPHLLSCLCDDKSFQWLRSGVSSWLSFVLTWWLTTQAICVFMCWLVIFFLIFFEV